MWMFSGQSETEGQCDVQQGQLLTSLTTYVELYSPQKDYFKYTADYVCRIASRAQNQTEVSEKYKAAMALMDALGGVNYGGVIGLVSGGVAGIMGSVAASAALFRHDLSAVSASVGFLGGVLGSIAGATFASVLGGAVWKAAESTGYSIGNKAYSLPWCVVGGATGANIGHIFGGKVGKVAGAVGGAFGALCGVIGFLECKNALNSQGLKHEDLAQNFSCDAFRRNTSPLIAELSIINTISCKMETGACGVALQSSKCLNAVSRMEKALADVLKTPQSVSCLMKAAEDCVHVSEELETMKCEAEKLLASWSRQNNAV